MRLPGCLWVVPLTALACADEALIPIPDRPQPPAPEHADGEVDEEPVPEAPAPPTPPDPPDPPTTSGEACESDDACGTNAECAGGTCIGVGLLQVTLTFEVDADYDLHVITPTREEIFYNNARAGGGVLDVDQCVFYCGTGTHVENVYFNDEVERGLYQAYVINYDGRAGGDFHIEVSGAATTSLDGSMPAERAARSEDLLWAIE